METLQRWWLNNDATAARFGDPTKEHIGISPEMSLWLIVVQPPLQESMQGDEVEMGLERIVMLMHLHLHGGL